MFRFLALSLALSFQVSLFAQDDNLQVLIDQVEEGKAYALYQADKPGPQTISEDKGYYIRIVPSKFKIVKDTIELSPPLNGNLDTSNYFIQSEVLVLKEQAVDWKFAKISPLCSAESGKPYVSLCLIKTTPKYQIVNRKFFPFKNILDTSNTNFIIPAKTIIIEREELLEPPRLERLPLSPEPKIASGEKLIKVSLGIWKRWEEVICPYGIFNNPEMREIQQALINQGYKVEITGMLDEQSKAALHEYQKDNMLEVGSIDEATINRLGVRREPLIQVIND